MGLLVPERRHGLPPRASLSDALLLLTTRCALCLTPPPSLALSLRIPMLTDAIYLLSFACYHDNMPSQEEDALKAHSQARSSSDDEGSSKHWEEPEDPHPPLLKERRLGSPDPDFVPQYEGPRRSARRLFAVEAVTDEALEQQVEEVPAQVSTHKRKRGQRFANKVEGIYEVTILDPKDGDPIEPAGVSAKWQNCCGKVKKHTLHKKEQEDKAKEDWRRQLLMFAIDKESGCLDPNLQAAMDAFLCGSSTSMQPSVSTQPFISGQPSVPMQSETENITKDTPCELHVPFGYMGKMMKVASGMAFPGEMLHNRDILPGYMRVTVSEIIPGYEDNKIECPIPEAGIETLQDALSFFIIWKRRDVVLSPRVSPPPLSRHESFHASQPINTSGQPSPMSVSVQVQAPIIQVQPAPVVIKASVIPKTITRFDKEPKDPKAKSDVDKYLAALKKRLASIDKLVLQEEDSRDVLSYDDQILENPADDVDYPKFILATKPFRIDRGDRLTGHAQMLNNVLDSDMVMCKNDLAPDSSKEDYQRLIKPALRVKGLISPHPFNHKKTLDKSAVLVDIEKICYLEVTHDKKVEALWHMTNALRPSKVFVAIGDHDSWPSWKKKIMEMFDDCIFDVTEGKTSSTLSFSLGHRIETNILSSKKLIVLFNSTIPKEAYHADDAMTVLLTTPDEHDLITKLNLPEMSPFSFASFQNIVTQEGLKFHIQDLSALVVNSLCWINIKFNSPFACSSLVLHNLLALSYYQGQKLLLAMQAFLPFFFLLCFDGFAGSSSVALANDCRVFVVLTPPSSLAQSHSPSRGRRLSRSGAGRHPPRRVIPGRVSGAGCYRCQRITEKRGGGPSRMKAKQNSGVPAIASGYRSEEAAAAVALVVDRTTAEDVTALRSLAAVRTTRTWREPRRSSARATDDVCHMTMRLSELEEIYHLGTGASGVVTKVCHRLTGAVFALKTTFFPNRGVDDDEQTEAEALRRSAGCPHVVRCHAVLAEPEENVLAYVPELMDAGTLGAILKKRGNRGLLEPALAETAARCLDAGRAGPPARLRGRASRREPRQPPRERKRGRQGRRLQRVQDLPRPRGGGAPRARRRRQDGVHEPRAVRARRHPSAAADVWGLGITVLELFTGRRAFIPAVECPQYADLRRTIFDGDTPSVPEGCRRARRPSCAGYRLELLKPLFWALQKLFSSSSDEDCLLSLSLSFDLLLHHSLSLDRLHPSLFLDRSRSPQLY
ncbi:hypothetical protein PR202_ga10554 [Eleusine coracana subsp. coracana]|uniref:Protein kinase domain-containing protein n=1 Tax=Eleusine coracana subsp. coracana TaxID=191504 RepID=A0AAV5C705_ELECO|nr:hypothetical protein PR202_ga10554 [Eleusine coracana subsp. coracana]